MFRFLFLLPVAPLKLCLSIFSLQSFDQRNYFQREFKKISKIFSKKTLCCAKSSYKCKLKEHIIDEKELSEQPQKQISQKQYLIYKSDSDQKRPPFDKCIENKEPEQKKLSIYWLILKEISNTTLKPSRLSMMLDFLCFPFTFRSTPRICSTVCFAVRYSCISFFTWRYSVQVFSFLINIYGTLRSKAACLGLFFPATVQTPALQLYESESLLDVLQRIFCCIRIFDKPHKSFLFWNNC